MSVVWSCTGKGSSKHKSSRNEELKSDSHEAPESQQCEGTSKYTTEAEEKWVFQMTNDLPYLNSSTHFSAHATSDRCECGHHGMSSATSTEADGTFASVSTLWSAKSLEMSDTESARFRPQGTPQYLEGVESVHRELRNIGKHRELMKQMMEPLAKEETVATLGDTVTNLVETVKTLAAKLDNRSDRTNNAAPQATQPIHQNFVFHITINNGEPEEEGYPRFVLGDEVNDNIKTRVNAELQPEHNLEVKEVRQGSIVIVLDTSRLDQPGLAKFFTALATGSLSKALLRGVKAGVADDQLELALDGCWPEQEATHPGAPTPHPGRNPKKTTFTQTTGLRTVASKSNIVISPASRTSDCSENARTSRCPRHSLRASGSEIFVKNPSIPSLTRKPSKFGLQVWLREKFRRSSRKHGGPSLEKPGRAKPQATRPEGAAAEDYNSTVSSQLDEGYCTVNSPPAVMPRTGRTRDFAAGTSVATCEKAVATDT